MSAVPGSGSGDTPNFDGLVSLFSTLLTAQQENDTRVAQLFQEQKTIQNRLDGWDSVRDASEAVKGLKQDFQVLHARLDAVVEMQKKRFEETAEQARRVAISKGVVISFLSLAALPVSPILGGAALGGALRATLYAQGAQPMPHAENQFQDSEWFKQLLIGCMTGLGIGAAGAVATPLIASSGNPVVGRLLFQGLINAGNTVIEKGVDGQPISKETLVFALAAGGGAALTGGAVEQLVGNGAPRVVRVIHAGAVSAANAGANKVIENACEKRPLAAGLGRAVAVAFPVGAAVQAVTLHNEQAALLQEAEDYIRDGIEENLKTGWQLPEGTTLDVAVEKILLGEAVDMMLANQVYRINVNQEFVAMADGAFDFAPLATNAFPRTKRDQPRPRPGPRPKPTPERPFPPTKRDKPRP